MDFSKVKSIVIPEGVVTKIVAGGRVLWQKIKEVVTLNNLLSKATTTDRNTLFGEDYNGDGKADGYLAGKRLSSSGSESATSAMCCSGFIPAKSGDILRIKGALPKISTASYVITYDSSNTKVAYQSIAQATGWTNTSANPWQSVKNGVLRVRLDDNFGTGFDAVRFSASTINEYTIATINEEILPYHDKVVTSINTDGSIYNGGFGYKNGYRLNSSATETAKSGAAATGYIPAKNGDVFYMSGVVWNPPSGGATDYSYISFFDSSFNKLAHINQYIGSTGNGVSNIYNNTANTISGTKTDHSITTDSNGVTTFNIAYGSAASKIAYIRISAVGDGGDMTVTVNEEIVDIPYTNRLPLAVDTDGVTIYGGDYNGDGKPDGYKTDTYLSSGNTGTRAGVETTGFIPIGTGYSNSTNGTQVIYLRGVSGTAADEDFRIMLYNHKKAYLQQFIPSQFASNDYGITIPTTTDADGNFQSIDISAITAHLRDSVGKGLTAYFRLCAPHIDGNSIITVNEEIV